MKKVFLLIAVVAAAVLTGCTSTQSTITEYDQAGNISKVTESSESVISSVVKSTKDKTVIVWEDGWAAYMSISAATPEDPTPHMKMFAGKTNRGVANVLKEQKSLSDIAKIIQATKSDLSVSATGIETDTKSSAKSEKAEEQQ